MKLLLATQQAGVVKVPKFIFQCVLRVIPVAALFTVPVSGMASSPKPAAHRHEKRQSTSHVAQGEIRTPGTSSRKHRSTIRIANTVGRSKLSGKAFGIDEPLHPPLLRSTVAFAVDEDTGKALYEKNSSAVVPIASVTKLMTAMVVLDSKESLTDMISVTDEDRDYEKFTGSRLSVGSVLSREDMLHIALMASENRAAAALSRYFPGGRPAFLEAMNAKASALGMTDTHFESPTGLTSKNVSTARDLVKMVEAAYQYPLIRRFSTDRAYEVSTGIRTISYHSTNALIHDPRWTIGLQKTGFINEAGICLVMQTTIDNRPIVMVLLDSAGKYSDFADASALRTYVIADERGG